MNAVDRSKPFTSEFVIDFSQRLPCIVIPEEFGLDSWSPVPGMLADIGSMQSKWMERQFAASFYASRKGIRLF